MPLLAGLWRYIIQRKLQMMLEIHLDMQKAKSTECQNASESVWFITRYIDQACARQTLPYFYHGWSWIITKPPSSSCWRSAGLFLRTHRRCILHLPHNDPADNRMGEKWNKTSSHILCLQLPCFLQWQPWVVWDHGRCREPRKWCSLPWCADVDIERWWKGIRSIQNILCKKCGNYTQYHFRPFACGLRFEKRSQYISCVRHLSYMVSIYSTAHMACAWKLKTPWLGHWGLLGRVNWNVCKFLPSHCSCKPCMSPTRYTGIDSDEGPPVE